MKCKPFLGYISWVALFGATLFCMQGCSNRQQLPYDLTYNTEFKPRIISTSHFTLLSFIKYQEKAKILHVYIEGDGAAWEDIYTPAYDPTPIRPMGLKLALGDSHPAVAYLARPCHYFRGTDKNCHVDYWTEARYGIDVLKSMNAALDHLKNKTRAKVLHLYGYSGGGALAVLLAAQRRDVARITTFVANLDLEAWVAYHDLTPLTLSQDPLKVCPKVRNLSQTHYQGMADDTVPPVVNKRYQACIANQPHAFKIIPYMAHESDWDKFWEVINSTELQNQSRYQGTAHGVD